MRKYLVLILLVSIMVMGIGVGAEEYVEGNWMVETDENPLTDEFELKILNVKDYSNGLGLRYQDGSLEIMLMTEYLGTDSDEYFSDVVYRFDKNEVIETVWSTASNDKGLFFKKSEHTKIEFIERLMKYQQLAVGYYPYNENMKTLEYDLTGFTAAITPYLDKIGLEELK